MNIKEMTTENQIAIAEACGWIEIYRPELYEYKYRNTKTGQCSNYLPDYNSLDSMQAAVLAQDEEFQEKFDWNCYQRLHSSPILSGPDKHFHLLTITDWQDSFMETLKQLGRLKK